MFIKPTVFVIGAGASVHLGYPTGIKLKEKIISELQFPNELFQYLVDDGQCIQGNVENFCEELEESKMQSVDAFLEDYCGPVEKYQDIHVRSSRDEDASPEEVDIDTKQEFESIGKSAIVYLLLQCEDVDKFSTNINWYHWLRDMLDSHKDLKFIGENKLSIITFNYDRSLEMYLYKRLINSYQVFSEEINKVVEEINKIQIIHVHGKLCNLPWQSIEKSRTYNKNLPVTHKDIINSPIKIIHEELHDNEEFIQAREVLKNAEVICFIGFGYLERNIERLQIPWDSDSFKIGTCHRLEESDKKRLTNKYNNLQLVDVSHGISKFLNNNSFIQSVLD